MTKSELILEQFRRYANSADMMSKLHSREILSGYGNSELNCIDCIGRMKHPNAARIADEMDLTRSAVSKILRKLIAKDAAISYQLPGNQKEIYYKLTPYGRELFRQHRLRHLNWEQRDREFFDSLDPAILDTALEFMNAYNGYLERKLAEEMAAGDPSERIADGDAPEDDGVPPCADNFL